MSRVICIMDLRFYWKEKIVVELDAACQEGKLRVDEHKIFVVALFKQQLWSIPCDSVTGLTIQQRRDELVNLTLHTEQRKYLVHSVSNEDCTKLRTLFSQISEKDICMQLDITCKGGKLCVDEHELFHISYSKQKVWSVPYDAVTRFISQSGLSTVSVTIHTTQSNFVVHRIYKSQFEMLKAAFPHLIEGDILTRLDTMCREGKFQVNKRELFVVTSSNKKIWSALCSSVKEFTIRPERKTVDLIVHTTQGNFAAHSIKKDDFGRLQALFPQITTVTIGKEWYWNPTALTHVATYPSLLHLQVDMENSTQHGWMIQAMTGAASSSNVRLAVGKFPFAGSVNLTSHSRNFTVVFVRTPAWLAREKRRLLQIEQEGLSVD